MLELHWYDEAQPALPDALPAGVASSRTASASEPTGAFSVPLPEQVGLLLPTVGKTFHVHAGEQASA
ncbi:hypothetical protein V3N99_21370 [Dermatophilaceae bacterium Soc4.6]